MLNILVFFKDIFHANFEFKGKHSHCSISICQKQPLHVFARQGNWKILSYFVANLSKTVDINFYQNQSSIVKFTTKNMHVFMPLQCRPIWQQVNVLARSQAFLMSTIKRRKLSWFGHVCRHDTLSKTILDRTTQCSRHRGRPCKSWKNNIKQWTGQSLSLLRCTLQTTEI